MKITIRIFSITLVLICFIAIVVFISFVKRINYASDIPIELNCSNMGSQFDFDSELSGINANNLEKQFPYAKYIEFGNYCNADGIEDSLAEMNKVHPNQSDLNRDILISTLTYKLDSIKADRFENFNSDSLIELLQWVDDFRVYENISPENRVLFGIIYDYWMIFITNQLEKHYDRQPSVRFDFKFKYLQSICQSKRFAPAIGMSNLEKVVDYSINGEFAYLFNRFWNGTGILLKCVIALFILKFTYMLYCTFKYSIKK